MCVIAQKNVGVTAEGLIMDNPPICVWFKRDLRIDDHVPLYEAAQAGPLLPLYIIEPDLIKAPDFSSLHWNFIRECLIDLNDQLSTLGQPLIVRRGDALSVLEKIRQQTNFKQLYSHEETGNALTFARDRRVAIWAKEQSILWRQTPQNGVVRSLHNRNGWAAQWEKRMRQPLRPKPHSLKPLKKAPVSDPLYPATDLGLPTSEQQLDVIGGSKQANQWLDTFLSGRGLRYSREMSSPNTAYSSCSRLSPYLAHGCLSVRSVTQTARNDQINQIQKGFFNLLNQFEPFGIGNEQPIFKCINVIAVRGTLKVVGKDHLKMEIMEVNNPKLRVSAIAFNQIKHFDYISKGFSFDVCYSLETNEWQGNQTLQANIKDIQKSK